MKPVKYHRNFINDNRGYLLELIPSKVKIKFNYSIITSSKKNVIRGMHYNKKMNEHKLIYVLKGKILDVTVNLNKGKNFGKIFYFNLKQNDILYIPKGFAHGYQCLENENSILYFLSEKYKKQNNSGFSWCDKNFNIRWKTNRPVLSKKDKNLKEYNKN